tara:strand:- start:228 stop:440 length:213 start_codon:yes stop_codon:yes gene_type:complete
METLEQTLSETHGWAISRMNALCLKASDIKDAELVIDAESIRKEFDEWLDPKIEDHDIVSLEYIGEGSEY